MSYITESKIEEYTIQLLEKLGYEYIYAPNIAPDSLNPQRTSFSEIIFPKRVKSAIKRITNDW